MNIKEFIKPTKQKIYIFVILIIGLKIIPSVSEFIYLAFLSRTLGPEKLGDFLIFKSTNIPYILITNTIYLLWFYLIVSIIVNISKKKSL